MTRGKNKKDEIDMQSSPLSIEFADGVPQTYQKSTLRVSLSEQRAEGRSESQEADLTVVTNNTSPASKGFFFSLLNPEV